MAIADREKAIARQGQTQRKAAAVASLERLRVGDVIRVPSGRRAGLAVVLDPATGGFGEPRPLVLTQDRWAGRVSPGDFTTPAEVLARIRVPKHFNHRSPGARRDLAAEVSGTGLDRHGGRRRCRRQFRPEFAGKQSFDTNSRTIMSGLTAYGRSNGFEALGHITYANGDDFEDGDGNVVRGSETNFASGLGKIAYQAESGDRIELSHEEERIQTDADRQFGQTSKRPATCPWNPESDAMCTICQNTAWPVPIRTKCPKAGGIRSSFWPIARPTSTSINTCHRARPFTPTPARAATHSLNGKLENKFALAFGSVTAGMDFYSDETKLIDQTYTAREYADNIGIYAQAG